MLFYACNALVCRTWERVLAETMQPEHQAIQNVEDISTSDRLVLWYPPFFVWCGDYIFICYACHALVL